MKEHELVAEIARLREESKKHKRRGQSLLREAVRLGAKLKEMRRAKR